MLSSLVAHQADTPLRQTCFLGVRDRSKLIIDFEAAGLLLKRLLTFAYFVLYPNLFPDPIILSFPHATVKRVCI